MRYKTGGKNLRNQNKSTNIIKQKILLLIRQLALLSTIKSPAPASFSHHFFILISCVSEAIFILYVCSDPSVPVPAARNIPLKNHNLVPKTLFVVSEMIEQIRN